MAGSLEHATQSPEFDDIPTQTVISSAGRHYTAPIRFGEATFIGAAFPAPAAKVATLLPVPRLKPLLLAPGMSFLQLFAAEYHSVAGVQPYHEVGIMVPALYASRFNPPLLPLLFSKFFPTIGSYVYALPVTTEESCHLGVDLWGFPKFLADIDFEDSSSLRRCSVHADGRHLLSLEVEKGPTTYGQTTDALYSVQNGWLLKTLGQWQGEYSVGGFRGGATLRLGDHPVAETLGRLRMGRRVISRSYARVQGLLHLPAQHLRLS